MHMHKCAHTENVKCTVVWGSILVFLLHFGPKSSSDSVESGVIHFYIIVGTRTAIVSSTENGDDL